MLIELLTRGITMTLNSRTSLMILPVIMLGYSVAFIGVYDTFRKVLIEAETAEAQMQVAELADSLTLYSMMLDQYFLTIQQHPDVQRLLSSSAARPKVQHAARKAIADIGVAPQYRLTAAALNKAGELQYIYRDVRGSIFRGMPASVTGSLSLRLRERLRPAGWCVAMRVF